MRGHGEGSITQRKDGRWQAQISLENGKRKTYYGKTKREVQETLRVAINQQKQGKLALGSNQTVKQFLDEWLENVHRHVLAPNSYAIYRGLLNNHIFPAFGHVKLGKLTTRQIDTLYGAKLKAGYAVETVRAMHRMLHKAFDDAVRWKVVSFNVCDEVKAPRAKKYEIHPLTYEQAKALLVAVQGKKLEALLTLAIATGMREGEILGLRWGDINIADRTLFIHRTVYRVRKKGIIEGEPKTEASKAKITLPQFVIDALLVQKVRQAEIRVKAGEKWVEKDLVFPNRVGKFLTAGYLRLLFKKVLQDAGLPHMRFHDLRHSAATILLNMGVHPKIVQGILRHSNIAQTMRYSHVSDENQRETMNSLDQLFQKGEEN